MITSCIEITIAVFGCVSDSDIGQTLQPILTIIFTQIFGAKSWPSSFIGEIALTVKKWRPFQFFWMDMSQAV